MPERIQLRRARGWRKPEGAIVVSRPGCWGNPFAVGTPMALARVPALDGSPWEHEGRISAHGMSHPYQHPDGHWTAHTVRYMTRQECVDLYARALTNPTSRLRLTRRVKAADPDGKPITRLEVLTVWIARAELAGRDLACWCPPWEACHADVLLRVANGASA